ncbi:hypothetical protein EHI8A_174020 [Entamoeba histolytica HM-1:IMSS-B]|uniref:Uncharacterized protein n=6 Tax=Entamoeba histolytica TaxID=5759 RepID=C4M4Y9_ENTH1|nr:hypothetical protein EHI_035220 [Entamoeba histolytica HM-1:IMSS]EMD45741.1 Hypothetical protein EHI5A_082000 [Entamoeba histolytica KU27]EMH73701.1 hypothetical protein EHI8A_174020 [Entamoeba histolytica HM-1:IMSS-B]EMS17828.1 hypothetical protein KM1_104110 [Entamoeba histolytica HM-3:IMSS]ENY65272.1 hypothetical protein EHI7A_079920 [Entamoeba histolytica HM-1:IMSS-A]GAT96470.1 hypothetical protein CL6EHI_035220 [Entamoeba histolytica]|eukprot:XP_656226.1 hypothetical protein EHI_035220 [Entamoeba histolytica HM-1:IMSS]
MNLYQTSLPPPDTINSQPTYSNIQTNEQVQQEGGIINNPNPSYGYSNETTQPSNYVPYQSPQYYQQTPVSLPSYNQTFTSSEPKYEQEVPVISSSSSDSEQSKWFQFTLTFFLFGFCFIFFWLASFVISRKSSQPFTRVIGTISIILFLISFIWWIVFVTCVL